jgi:hypothetical protein
MEQDYTPAGEYSGIVPLQRQVQGRHSLPEKELLLTDNHRT